MYFLYYNIVNLIKVKIKNKVNKYEIYLGTILLVCMTLDDITS